MHEPLPIHEAEQALLYVAADCDRDVWFSVAGALKDEYGEAGFDLFDAFSQQGQSYEKGACKATWRSAKAGHYTIGTLIKLAVQGGWQRPKRELTAEEKRALRKEQAERRKARQAEVEADEKRAAVMREAVSQACVTIWQEYTRLVDVKAQPYLQAKGVGAHGVREARQPVLLVVDDAAGASRVLAGNEIRQFFSTVPKPRPDSLSYLKLDFRDLVVPMRDAAGKLWSVQVIKAGGTKLFPRYGRKKGCFHVIGDLDKAELVGFSEGYATSASVYEMGTGWPVVCCFDSGNMLPVGQAFHGAGLMMGRPPVWAADNDAVNAKTGKQAGQDAALACQAALGGVVYVPPAPVGEAA
ncbi:PriCT-2 domain-containing protein [Alcanivorax sp.]|jgi:putative DNA primase/helicase|uniref:PriCT-2 domain-containing protein n=1 Tax=Alcanivorax sp. TaxID=1872427 RepID=UPI0032D95DDF